MAKKKKTQLKPVARGFAVTSVPKKTIQVDEDRDESLSVSSEPHIEEKGSPVAESSANEERDSVSPEERALQSLVDTLQEKTEKEISRNVKAIEQDRRFSKTFLRLELDPFFVDQIIALARETYSEGKLQSEEPEDRVLGKLAVTYGVLRRLGFSEARVEECLKSINGVSLEDAYDWLYINCTEDELEDIQGGHALKLITHPGHFPNSYSFDLLSPSPQTPTAQREGAHSSTNSTPRRTTSPMFPPLGDESSKLRALDTLDAVENGIDEIDTDDPTQEYVRLKLLLDRLCLYRRGETIGDSEEAAQLRKRISAVKRDYLFDENEAEVQYREERKKVDAIALREKLTGAVASETSVEHVKLKKRSTIQVTVPEDQKSQSFDIFDGDDESSAGLLDVLQMSNTETTPEGITITLKDMTLPKHSGRMPKALLQDTVVKKDRYAAVTYSIVSGPSLAKRASVGVRWDGQRTETWTMSDVACRDERQAEQYVATVALHALSFPPSDGFSSSSQTGPTFFRSLPPAYRDLWDELEDNRKEAENTKNRALWAKVRAIIEPKLDAESKAADRAAKPTTATEERHYIRQPISKSDPPEKLIESIRERQASPNYQRMLAQRNQLPIAQYRSQILSALELSQILVLSGETGCGKSTQLPAFLLEDHLSRGKHCKIYCTEPRRISAISLAQRVSQELGEAPNAVGTPGSLVGYSIRLESNTSRTTRLTFVTNGIALRMLESGTGPGGQGTAFDEITHIVIDEVHERTIESDFLLIVLKSLLNQRSDLKVILMSATVDADKISAYFGNCPTLYVPGRTFPVEVRYLEDAVQLTNWHITENSPYARRLHDKFYKGKSRPEWSEDLTPADDDEEQSSSEVNLGKRYSPDTTMTINLLDERLIPYDLIIRLMQRICFEDASYASYSSAILIFMPGLAEIRRMIDILSEHPLFGKENEFRIYPLHSTLSSESQSAVFEVPPSDVRKIVISTNVAETGITIPDITCVIDTGKHREMRFDEKRQISRLVETFVAKSNAIQRRGRAGRVQHGLCFHLFTKFRHDMQLADNPLPEMLRLSLSDLSLRIKIMKVKLGSSIEEVLSKALDPPASINVQRAVSMLVEVRALTPAEDITPMGRLLSKLPTDVHLGKFLLIATLFRCLDPALTIAATLNSKSPFVTPFGLEQEADRAKASFKIENSDFLTIHNAFSSWRRASSVSLSNAKKFCRTNYLSHQNLQQIEEMRQQFLGYLVDSSFIHVDKGFIRDLNHSRHGRYRTRFVSVPPEYDANSSNTTLLHATLVAGLYPKILSIDSSAGVLRTASNQVAAFHPSSVNFNKKLMDIDANYLVYFTLMHSKKLYAWETCPVDDISLILLCGDSDFKLVSDTIMIDRKFRFQVSPKTNIALKLLRNHLSSSLAHQMRNKVLTKSQVPWNDLAVSVLGKMKEGRDTSIAVIR